MVTVQSVTVTVQPVMVTSVCNGDCSVCKGDCSVCNGDRSACNSDCSVCNADGSVRNADRNGKTLQPLPNPTPPHPHLNSPNPPRVTFTFLGTRLDRRDAGGAGGALHCPLTFTLTLDPAQRHLQEGEEGRGHAFIQHDAGTHNVGQGV